MATVTAGRCVDSSDYQAAEFMRPDNVCGSRARSRAFWLHKVESAAW